MVDQASKLRERMQASTQRKQSTCRTIAVVSGKGGVGKSNITLNVAVTLATKYEQKVLILDLDFGMSNLHLLIGKTPKYSLIDCLQLGIPFSEAMMEGAENLYYMSGGNGLKDIFSFSTNMRERLVDQLEQLSTDYDFIFLDMGAGATEQTLTFLSTADEVLIVTTPEPTAMTDAYSMMKYLHVKYEDRPFYLVCNRAFSTAEAKEAVERLSKTVKQFLHKDIIPVGIVLENQKFRQAVLNQVPVTVKYPSGEVAKSFHQIAARFVQSEVKQSSSLSFFQKLRNRLVER